MQSPTNPAPAHKPTLTDTVEAIEEAIGHHVHYSLGKAWQSLSQRDLFVAVALAVRDRMVDKMFETAARYRKADAKRLYYISMEFLIGRLLGTNLQNLGLLSHEEQHSLRADIDRVRISAVKDDRVLIKPLAHFVPARPHGRKALVAYPLLMGRRR